MAVPKQMLQRSAGGHLLGLAAALATALERQLRLVELALHVEALVVGLAVGGHHLVSGQRQPVPLQVLLEACLGVLAQFVGIDGVQQRLIEALDDARSRGKAGFEEDGTQQCLDGIGQDGGAAMAAALAFALAQDQRIGQ